MPRPTKRRRVCRMPENSRFGPLNDGLGSKATVVMTVDEYETIRLIDFDALTQEECAALMDVARTTVQGIYAQARKKLAEALVTGKMLIIQGGEYRLCEGFEGKSCKRKGCHGRGHGREG
jgi:predicted DNA-binding protein (UPF0251 family)